MHLGWAYAHIAAQTAIAAGLVVAPFLVLPYLPISRAVFAFAAATCAGFALSHLWTMTAHPHAAPFWVLEHLALAACLWALIADCCHRARAPQPTPQLKRGR